MSHTSPATFLVWSILSIMLGIFFVFHLWSFDRFKCLKWNTGPSSGAFKRVMTYSYLCSVPLIIAYAVGNTIIKYQEGFIFVPGTGVIPKPYQMWKQSSQDAIFPFMLFFSVAWSFEMVTHLEELCFWLFLVNSGSAQQDWFKSFYFRIWTVGSCVAVIYLPLISIFTRHDHIKSEGYMFLAGSLGSLSLTLWFTPVLWTFPSFLRNLKNEGVDIQTLVRLTTFHELNSIRIVFRLLFTVPLLILGADGFTAHTHINESMWWTDFLAMVSGFGCVVSSAITLVIFFPRSIEGEITAKDIARETRQTRSGKLTATRDFAETEMSDGVSISQGGTYLLTSSPVKQRFGNDAPEYSNYPYETSFPPAPQQMEQSFWHSDGDASSAMRQAPLRPNRRGDETATSGRTPAQSGSLSEHNISLHNNQNRQNGHLSVNVNHLLHNFRSPIDMGAAPVQKYPDALPRFKV